MQYWEKILGLDRKDFFDLLFKGIGVLGSIIVFGVGIWQYSEKKDDELAQAKKNQIEKKEQEQKYLDEVKRDNKKRQLSELQFLFEKQKSNTQDSISIAQMKEQQIALNKQIENNFKLARYNMKMVSTQKLIEEQNKAVVAITNYSTSITRGLFLDKDSAHIEYTSSFRYMILPRYSVSEKLNEDNLKAFDYFIDAFSYSKIINEYNELYSTIQFVPEIYYFMDKRILLRNRTKELLERIQNTTKIVVSFPSITKPENIPEIDSLKNYIKELNDLNTNSFNSTSFYYTVLNNSLEKNYNIKKAGKDFLSLCEQVNYEDSAYNFRINQTIGWINSTMLNYNSNNEVSQLSNVIGAIPKDYYSTFPQNYFLSTFKLYYIDYIRELVYELKEANKKDIKRLQQLNIEDN